MDHLLGSDKHKKGYSLCDSSAFEGCAFKQCTFKEKKIVMAGIGTNPVYHCPSPRVLLKVLVRFNTSPYISLANILKEMLLSKENALE